MLLRVISRLRHLADEIIVTTRKRWDFIDTGIRQVADIYPGLGSLGGFYTALFHARGDIVMAVACDMPFVNSDLFLYQIRQLTDVYDAVIPITTAGMEPLHALYRREPCIRAVEKAIMDGRKRLDSWISDVRVCHITEDQFSGYPPGIHSFINLNTPEDVIKAEELTRSIE